MNTDTMMTSTILVCTFASLVGVLIGLALAKMQANSEAETAFEAGREQGKEEGVLEAEERFKEEKEVIKDGLSRNLAGIRDSIVKAVEAYEDTVQSVEEQFDVAPGELLGPTEQEQRLLTHVRNGDVDEDDNVDEAVRNEEEAVIDQVEEDISRELSGVGSATNGKEESVATESALNSSEASDSEGGKKDCQSVSIGDSAEKDKADCCGGVCDSELETKQSESEPQAENEGTNEKKKDSPLTDGKSVLHDNVKIH